MKSEIQDLTRQVNDVKAELERYKSDGSAIKDRIQADLQTQAELRSQLDAAQQALKVLLLSFFLLCSGYLSLVLLLSCANLFSFCCLIFFYYFI